MRGGERHPTAETALRRISAKNDKRKTAKAVTPLRFKESLFLLCRDLTSTCRLESPHVLTRIFLTGYPSILGMVYVDAGKSCSQTIKIPPNENRSGGKFFSLGHEDIAHQNTVFFIWWTCCYVIRKPMNNDCSTAHRLCVYASGSLMTVICKSFISIKTSCLHFGQYRG